MLRIYIYKLEGPTIKMLYRHTPAYIIGDFCKLAFIEAKF